jgi:hypothetical protein
MAPLPRLAAAAFFLASFAAAEDPPPRGCVLPRGDVARYLAQTKGVRSFCERERASADDAAKFYADAELAVQAYESATDRKVVFTDNQDFASIDFYKRTGAAQFNPNGGQTAKLKSLLDGLLMGGPFLQTDAVYEALVATDGNMTLAMGSLAQLFCQDRDQYVPKVSDMDKDANGKNYYRFAGFFIGLHDAGTRAAGLAGSYANMAGNPVVYAGAELIHAWASLFTTGHIGGADTLRTLGPQGNGDIVDKNGELQKGFDAALKLHPDT